MDLFRIPPTFCLPVHFDTGLDMYNKLIHLCQVVFFLFLSHQIAHSGVTVYYPPSLTQRPLGTSFHPLIQSPIYLPILSGCYPRVREHHTQWPHPGALPERRPHVQR